MYNIKSKLKKFVPPLPACLYREWPHRSVIKKYRTGIKNIKIKGNGNIKPTVVFIIQFPEVWNSIKTVYEAAVAAGLNTYILCVPKSAVNYASGYVNNSVNEAFEFMERIGIYSINAYDPKGKTWIDLQTLKPDYVFYARPYNKQYPIQYQNTSVCAYAKVCYIPYAYSMTEGGLSYASFNYDFLLATYLTFTPSIPRLKECKNRFLLQNILKSNKYVYVGFPRFDLLKTVVTCENNKKSNNIRRILWLPRWTVDNSEGQRPSSFFRYIYKFITYMQSHKDCELIIRPHPLMFKVILEKNILSENELRDLIEKIEAVSNISIDKDKDYLKCFDETDVLVSDYSSLLIEYFVSGKPILYCDLPQDFNEEAQMMNSTFYHADEWCEVEARLNKLLEGTDEKYMERLDVIKQLVPPNAGSIGKEIVNYIIADFHEK